MQSANNKLMVHYMSDQERPPLPLDESQRLPTSSDTSEWADAVYRMLPSILQVFLLNNLQQQIEATFCCSLQK
jgi:hypothetical protein